MQSTIRDSVTVTSRRLPQNLRPSSSSSSASSSEEVSSTIIVPAKSSPRYPMYRCGIENLGNTCFLNTSVQVLSRVHRFAQWIRTRGYLMVEGWDTKPDHLKHLTHQIQDIFDALRTPSTTTLRPRGFYMRFRNAVVAENMGWLMEGQNDSHECMMFMLDAVHKAVSTNIQSRPDVVHALRYKPTVLTTGSTSASDLRKLLERASVSSWYGHFGKEYNPVMTSMFHGQFMSIITSRHTDERSFKFEPFSSISLAVPEQGPTNGGPDGKGLISVKDCLDKFFESEIMTGDSKWESPTAGKVDAVRGVRMWRLPEVMILSLKRFTMTGGKVRTRIAYPVEGLDLASYCAGTALDEQDSVYDLVGVVIHVGMLFGGHYITVVRNPGGRWIVLNDIHARTIMPEQVENNPDAYTLVYQKASLMRKDDQSEAEWYEKKLKTSSDSEPSVSSGGDEMIDTDKVVDYTEKPHTYPDEDPDDDDLDEYDDFYGDSNGEWSGDGDILSGAGCWGGVDDNDDDTMYGDPDPEWKHRGLE